MLTLDGKSMENARQFNVNLYGQTIKGIRSLKKLVRAVSFGKPAVSQLERGGQLQYLVVGLD